MKITKSKLRRIIKEEYSRLQKEVEGSTDKNTEIIGSLIHAYGFLNARESLEQMGFKVDFVTSPLPMYILEKDGNKYAALNKKYAEDPDLIVGETAIGLMSEHKRLTEGFGDYSVMVDKLKKNLKKNNVNLFEPPKLKENDIDLWSDDEQSSQPPQELVKSWAKEIHRWIESQWSADSDFSSVREERPSVAAALRLVADELENAPEPKSYR